VCDSKQFWMCAALWEYPRESILMRLTHDAFWLHHKLSFYSELSSRTAFLTFFIPSKYFSHTSPNKLKHHSVIIVKITQLWHIFSVLESILIFDGQNMNFSLFFSISHMQMHSRCSIYKCSRTQIHKKCTQIYCYRLFELELNWFFST
jgi:hypothetical protein